MSWRVRRFLKQLREHKKDEEFRGEVSTKRVTINDATESPTDNDHFKPLSGIVAIDEAESYNIASISSVNNEISLLSRSSPSASSNGTYINWSAKHTELAVQPWCCIGDLMLFCDKYEYRTISLSDSRTHNNIIAEVKALLAVGQAPFDLRKRFPGNIHSPENLWVCIGRCASVEYHLKKIVGVFRKPLIHLPVDKQRVARQNFHLAVNELRLDISARISAVQLYDQNVFEREFHLHWQDKSQ